MSMKVIYMYNILHTRTNRTLHLRHGGVAADSKNNCTIIEATLEATFCSMVGSWKSKLR